MKYFGSFKNIYNTINYTLSIVTNNDESTEQEIILGTPPFVSTIEGDENNIYKPIKYTGATITIATDDVLSDIYSSKNQDVTVKLTHPSYSINEETGEETITNIVDFLYVTANIYTQNFNGDLQNFQIECIDGLTTLKNIDYDSIGEKKEIVSFLDIIRHILKKTNIIKTVAIQKSYETTSPTILNDLYVSESNFFDEDNKPMKCNEVLEELLKYVGLTLVQNAATCYIFDYDCDEKFANFTIENGSYNGDSQSVTFGNIFPNTFMSTNTNIELQNTFNKVSVEDDIYPIQEVANPLNTENLVPMSVESLDELKRIEPTQTIDGKEVKLKRYLYYRLLRSKNFTHYYYKWENGAGIPAAGVKITNWVENTPSLNDYIGATITQTYLSKKPSYLYTQKDFVTLFTGFRVYQEDEINLNTSILLHLHNSFTKDNFDYRKLLTFKATENNIILKEKMLVLNFTSKWVYNQPFFIEDPDSEIEKEVKIKNTYPSIPYTVTTTDGKIRKLTIIDSQKDDETSYKVEWLNIDEVQNFSECVENFYFFVDYDQNTLDKIKNWDKLSPEDKNNLKNNLVRKNIANEDLNLIIPNKFKYRSWIYNEDDESLINVTPLKGFPIIGLEGLNLADIQINFYQPANIVEDYNKYKLNGVWLNDFTISLTSLNQSSINEDDEQTNTKYENVIDENYLNEFESITFKCTTFDGKTPSFSTVYKKENNTLTFLDTLKHKSIADELCAEKLLITRIVNQYKEPKVILNLDLKKVFTPLSKKVKYPSQFGDKEFIISSLSTDYENEVQTLKIIEKSPINNEL